MSAAAVDLCTFDAVLADVSAYFVDTSAVAVDVSADVDVANINFVPAALNHATSPYNNIMSASRSESTGRSVKPSNGVTGINNQHEMWIQQVMIDDWGSGFLTNFRFVRSTHLTLEWLTCATTNEWSMLLQE